MTMFLGIGGVLKDHCHVVLRSATLQRRWDIIAISEGLSVHLLSFQQLPVPEAGIMTHWSVLWLPLIRLVKLSDRCASSEDIKQPSSSALTNRAFVPDAAPGWFMSPRIE